MTGAAETLAHDLPPPVRLAIAYAASEARPLWTALLALDQRLGRVASEAREPILAQLKLAWWRDRFRTPARDWPKGEPLLGALRPFDRERPALEALVDGWEAMVGGEADAAAIGRLADARAAALAALAKLVAPACPPEELVGVARTWALADLARQFPEATLSPLPFTAPMRLPRPLRPLTILLELAKRAEEPAGLRRFGRIVRLGLLGR